MCYHNKPVKWTWFIQLEVWMFIIYMDIEKPPTPPTHNVTFHFIKRTMLGFTRLSYTDETKKQKHQ